MIDVVFENENFVVCNKPSQVLSVPSRDRLEKRSCLGLLLKERYGTDILPVHRLDYEVSGLIIYALNSKAHKISQSWFEQKKITKMYIAKTSLQNFSHWPESVATDRSTIDITTQKEFFWRTQIFRGKKRSFESPQGSIAETRALIVDSDLSEISWQLYPLTGKPHQLRLELSRHGFPILGDQLYGSARTLKCGIALKAVTLDLTGISNRLGLPPSIHLPHQLPLD